MNLPNFTQDLGFNRLRKYMGAELQTWSSEVAWQAVSLEDSLSIYGEIEIPFEWLTVEADKTISFRGKKVLVYIRDQLIRYHENGYKFHIANCRTLVDYQNNGRYDKYVASIKRDGIFSVNLVDNGKIIEKDKQEELKVCKNCLDALNYKEYREHHSATQRNDAVDSFSIEEFFRKYAHQSVIRPKHTSATSPPDEYTKDWPRISKSYKKRKKYSCEHENCKLSLIEHPQFLHVHHISGHKANNRDENLKALCIGCHAEEPQHKHLKDTKSYQKFIDLFPYHWTQGQHLRIN